MGTVSEGDPAAPPERMRQLAGARRSAWVRCRYCERQRAYVPDEVKTGKTAGKSRVRRLNRS